MLLRDPENVGNSTDITLPAVKIVSESNKLYKRILEKYLMNYTIKYSSHTTRLLTLRKMLSFRRWDKNIYKNKITKMISSVLLIEYANLSTV